MKTNDLFSQLLRMSALSLVLTGGASCGSDVGEEGILWLPCGGDDNNCECSADKRDSCYWYLNDPISKALQEAKPDEMVWGCHGTESGTNPCCYRAVCTGDQCGLDGMESDQRCGGAGRCVCEGGDCNSGGSGLLYCETLPPEFACLLPMPVLWLEGEPVFVPDPARFSPVPGQATCHTVCSLQDMAGDFEYMEGCPIEELPELLALGGDATPVFPSACLVRTYGRAFEAEKSFGRRLACDDGNPCTSDSCSEDGGSCQTESIPDEVDGCVVSSCDPESGQMVPSTMADGSSCEGDSPADCAGICVSAVCKCEAKCPDGRCDSEFGEGPCSCPDDCVGTCSPDDGCWPRIEAQGPGCGPDCKCQDCVCQLRPECCSQVWDADCASLCGESCDGDCPATGDGHCVSGENCGNSPEDCGPCPNNGTCAPQNPTVAGCGGCACESCVCSLDPGCCTEGWTQDCASLCIGACAESGTDLVQPADCPFCGNSLCDPGETILTCPQDGCTPCGNGTCDPDENHCTCPADCVPACGDECCSGLENPCSCQFDCPGECDPDVGCVPVEDGLGGGCDGCECEECVCAKDPFCCEVMWDKTCAEICRTQCDGGCPIYNDGECGPGENCGTSIDDCGTCPAEGTCAPQDPPQIGCGGYLGGCYCEPCVCAFMPECCLTAWTEECAVLCLSTCNQFANDDMVMQPQECPFCGNGFCDAGEDWLTCPEDGCLKCGNGVCEIDETSCSCPVDCADLCGDGCCGLAENWCGCPDDCEPVCGDSCCTAGLEDACVCPADCLVVCGDGCCTDELEDACSCQLDCQSVCGDGCCTSGENNAVCATDCPTPCNNNGVCESFEDGCLCPSDCTNDPYGCEECECGSSGGICHCDAACVIMGDCCANASAICTEVPEQCGNGQCDSWENPCLCPEDCPQDDNTCEACECGGKGGPTCWCDTACRFRGDCCDSVCFACGNCFCGDGECGGSETTATCSVDCGSACGDSVCNGTEDCDGCPADCGGCCGNGICGTSESCLDCPQDCGSSDGCGTSGAAGCCGCGVEECVCSIHPECCTSGWSELCVKSARDDCGNCGGPEGGNSYCGELETACSEVSCLDSCGDSCCSGGEDPCNCFTDCPDDPDACDHICECGSAGSGSSCSCSENCVATGDCCFGACDMCGACSVCGDGYCGDTENACNCSSDCLAVCGDGCCTGLEDASSCLSDCGSICGDDLCTGSETCTSCPADCGSTNGCVVTDAPGCCGCEVEQCVCGKAPACCESGSGWTAQCSAIASDDCNGCGGPKGNNGYCGSLEVACGDAGCGLACDPVCPDKCGDGCCTGAESPADCSADCGTCGNGLCQLSEDEDCLTCSVDCGECQEDTPGCFELGPPPAGGWGELVACSQCVCDAMPECCDENWSWECAEMCSLCGFPCPECGDGQCESPFENCGTCPDDCFTCDPLGSCVANGQVASWRGCGGEACDCESCVCAITPHCCTSGWTFDCEQLCVETCGGICAGCGDGLCAADETCLGCPKDCGQCCGDGLCNALIGESTCTCSQDCGSACGDGCCTASESCTSCPLDCGAPGGCQPSNKPGCCGCQASLSACVCAIDPLCCSTVWDALCVAIAQDECLACGGPNDSNGYCANNETACSAPDDCLGKDVPGDGCCSGSETTCTSPEDGCLDLCGDGCCSSGEDMESCPEDCCAQCGDGCCSPAEKCTCVTDCGEPSCLECDNVPCPVGGAGCTPIGIPGLGCGGCSCEAFVCGLLPDCCAPGGGWGPACVQACLDWGVTCPVCGDGYCANNTENCSSCPADCGTCNPAGKCVAPAGAPKWRGCGGCDCQLCVCALNPGCCTSGWTQACQSICTETCGFTCE